MVVVSVATILLLTMMLQTLGATNQRVMLPLLVQQLGGDDSLIGYMQAVRYLSICLSLLLTPSLMEAVRGCVASTHDRGGGGGRGIGGGGADANGRAAGPAGPAAHTADLVTLGVLLAAIALLNVAMCSVALGGLAYVVGVAEAANCVVYIMLSSLSQTVAVGSGGDRVVFTTRMRLIQSFGSAALGPVALLCMSYAAPWLAPSAPRPHPASAFVALPSSSSSWSAAAGGGAGAGVGAAHSQAAQSVLAATSAAAFSVPFYLHAATTAALLVILCAAFCSGGGGAAASRPPTTPTTTLPAAATGAAEEPAAAAGLSAGGGGGSGTAQALAGPGKNAGCVRRGVAAVAAVVSGPAGRALLAMVLVQSVSSSLGEYVPIGIASHLKLHARAAATVTSGGGGAGSSGYPCAGDGNSDDGSRDVVLSDSVASAVAFCAVFAVGDLLRRLLARCSRPASAPSPPPFGHPDRRVGGGSSDATTAEVASAADTAAAAARGHSAVIRERAAVGAFLDLLNLAMAAGMLLLAVADSAVFVSAAYTLFRTTVRCLQVPTTVLVGLYIAEDDNEDNGEAGAVELPAGAGQKEKQQHQAGRASGAVAGASDTAHPTAAAHPPRRLGAVGVRRRRAWHPIDGPPVATTTPVATGRAAGGMATAAATVDTTAAATAVAATATDAAPRAPGAAPSRLSRLATAFSLFKFVRTFVKVGAAWAFARLYADGWTLAQLSWWCGSALAAASAAGLWGHLAALRRRR